MSKYNLRIIVVKPEHNVEVDNGGISISAKIRDAEENQIPVMVLGDKEIQHLIDIGYIREWF